jgi:hypothetical protein
VGFKLGSTGPGPTVQWDTLRIASAAPPTAPAISLSPTALSASQPGQNAPSQTSGTGAEARSAPSRRACRGFPSRRRADEHRQTDTLTVSTRARAGSAATVRSARRPAATTAAVGHGTGIRAGHDAGEDFEAVPVGAVLRRPGDSGLVDDRERGQAARPSSPRARRQARRRRSWCGASSPLAPTRSRCT